MSETLEFNREPLLQRVQAGDADAVASLLQRQFVDQSLKLQAFDRGPQLEIFLIDTQAIDQSDALARLQTGFSTLQLPWSQVNIESYVEGAAAPRWVAHLNLDTSFPQAQSPLNNAFDNRSLAQGVNTIDSLPQPVPLRRTSPVPLSGKPRSQERPQGKPWAPARSPQAQSLPSEAIGVLITGFVLAIPLVAVGLLRTLFYGFIILVHELGHAVTYWLLGYPAIPSVNILFGGGITLAMGRVILLVWALLAGLVYLGYRYRRSSNALSWILAVTVFYSLCTFSPWHLNLVASMGHGAENLAIVLCLYFAMGGYFCKLGGERSIYAMLGFFTWFMDLQFSWRLLYDAAMRANYLNGIGGMLDNDFVNLAGRLGVSLDAIVIFFLITSLLSPGIAFLLYRYESYWQRALTRR